MIICIAVGEFYCEMSIADLCYNKTVNIGQICNEEYLLYWYMIRIIRTRNLHAITSETVRCKIYWFLQIITDQYC